MTLIKKKWDDKLIISKVDGLMSKFDDGELFIEEVYSENILFDDNKIKNASFDQDKGFGLRTVKDDTINFFHSSDLSQESFLYGVKAINNHHTSNNHYNMDNNVL